MNILFIIPQEFEGNTWGGIMSYVVDLSRVLQRNGNTVSILTPGSLSQRFVRHDVQFYKIPVVSTFPWWIVPVMIVMRRFFPEIYERIRWAYSVRMFLCLHSKFDVVEAPEWGSSTALLPFWRNPSVVVRLHKSEFQYQHDNKFPISISTVVIDVLERWCMWTAAAVSSPTQFMALQYPLLRWYMRIRNRPIQHIPNGVLVHPQMQRRSRALHPYLLTVGRLEVAKGSALLLRAFMRIAKNYPRLHIYFIGEDTQMYVHKRWISYKKHMSTMLMGKDYIKRVHFLTRQSREKLARFYMNCVFYVIPSRGHENASMSLLEALAYGKAVVASDAGGSSEIVNAQKNGVLFKSDSVMDLAQAIEYLLDHPVRIRQFEKKAKQSTVALAVSAVMTEKFFHSVKNRQPIFE